MAEIVFPGVYVEEVGPPRSIEGVPTSVAAFLGQAATGPVVPYSAS
jgi:phage tail sheath protein FI